MTRRPAATLLAAVATIAFAGNSLLNRAALAGQTIDAPSFTLIRLWSGALLLAVLMQWRRGRDYWPTVGATRRDWIAAAALFAYAASFSFAYLRVGAGTGALLLFAVVQLSLQAYALGTGQRQSRLALAGLVMAMAGLGWLLLPGASAPGATGALLMVIGGVSWAVYTLAGRGGGDAVAMTANAFILSLPMTLLLLPMIDLAAITPHGVVVAVISGAITSGLGYVVWYGALPSLSLTEAGSWQLVAPVLAAIGGMLWLGEPLSSRLALATLLVVAGIGLTIMARRRATTAAAGASRRLPDDVDPS